MMCTVMELEKNNRYPTREIAEVADCGAGERKRLNNTRRMALHAGWVPGWVPREIFAILHAKILYFDACWNDG